MNKNEIFEELKEIFNNVNNWLNFAELKHSSLVVLNITIIFGGLSSYNVIKDMPLIKLILFFLIMSLAISISSFFPFFKLIKKWKFKRNDNFNLIFYKDIATFKVEEFIIALYKEYEGKIISSDKILKKEKYYAEEIIINAKITTFKYKLFRLSLLFILTAVLLILISFFIR